MASDTTLAPSGIAVDDCVGFAEPADILIRLTPDDLHPARLAGPHAWHPWGLTTAPPTDRHLRLILPAGASGPDAAERILDRLQADLTRTPWPPHSPLDVRRRDGQIDCRDDDARRSLIEVTVDPEISSRKHAEVVTRDGWPILNELAALNDRIRSINVDGASRVDLIELISWVEHKMPAPATGQSLVTSLPQLLTNQVREHPTSADRLRTILAHRGGIAIPQPRVLDYLVEQLDHCRAQGYVQRR